MVERAQLIETRGLVSILNRCPGQCAVRAVYGAHKLVYLALEFHVARNAFARRRYNEDQHDFLVQLLVQLKKSPERT